MNELFEKLILALSGVLGTLMLIIYRSSERRHSENQERIDLLSEEIKDVKTNSATRDTIVRLEDDWRDELVLLRKESKEERRENHADNSKRLDKIEEALSKVIELVIIVRDVKVEIGDHSSGIRGQLHEQRKQLVKLAAKVPNGLEAFE